MQPPTRKLVLGFTKSDRAKDYSSFMDGYRIGASQQVVELTVVDDQELMDLEWCDAAFTATNAPDEVILHHPGALRVMAALGMFIVNTAQNWRSLSTGDTVDVYRGQTRRRYECMSVGWREVEMGEEWQTTS